MNKMISNVYIKIGLFESLNNGRKENMKEKQQPSQKAKPINSGQEPNFETKKYIYWLKSLSEL